MLTRQERHELEGLTVDKLKGSIGCLSEVERLAQRERIDANDAKAFIDKYAHFVPTLPILGYLYFETLLDYILYYQDDATATEYANKGEFYNYYYKRIAKDINETLYKKFQLSSFAASADKLTAILRKYTDNGLIFKSFNEEHFVRFLAERLVYRVHNYLKIGHTMRDRSLINWSFEGLAEDFSPLLGHLIHRELRSFNRFPDFYYYFDQTKALKVWNYWNNHDIVIPFNGIVPKGEVGINPAYIDNTKYAIYQTKVTDHSGKLEITNKLDMRISSRLIDLKYTLMRNRK